MAQDLGDDVGNVRSEDHIIIIRCLHDTKTGNIGRDSMRQMKKKEDTAIKNIMGPNAKKEM